MIENIQCDDDCQIEVISQGGAILLSIVDNSDASTTRLDYTQTRQLAAVLIKALQVACGERLRQVQEVGT